MRKGEERGGRRRGRRYIEGGNGGKGKRKCWVEMEEEREKRERK
jgi:hypothetical protein